MTVLLDTHVLHWSSAEPERLSDEARRTIRDADELAVASVTWYELAWLRLHDRISVPIPVRAWLQRLGEEVRTVSTTPAIAVTAAELPESFAGDPIDRLIYATAIEQGWQLVTKDERIRQHRHSRQVAIW